MENRPVFVLAGSIDARFDEDVLPDGVWHKVEACLPVHRQSAKGGRRQADARPSFRGILWMLWSAGSWNRLPRRYGSATTCWRRYKEWHARGVFPNVWRAYLSQLSKGELDRWAKRLDECYFSHARLPVGPDSEWLRSLARQLRHALDDQIAIAKGAAGRAEPMDEVDARAGALLQTYQLQTENFS